MRRRLAALGVLIAALGGCSSPDSSSPSSVATTPPPSGMPSSADVQRFLVAARAAFPQRDDAALAQLAMTTCAQLKANPSSHDVVGDLAGQLGSQATAKQLVDAAVAAYCPGVAPTT